MKQGQTPDVHNVLNTLSSELKRIIIFSEQGIKEYIVADLDGNVQDDCIRGIMEAVKALANANAELWKEIHLRKAAAVEEELRKSLGLFTEGLKALGICCEPEVKPEPVVDLSREIRIGEMCEERSWGKDSGQGGAGADLKLKSKSESSLEVDNKTAEVNPWVQAENAREELRSENDLRWRPEMKGEPTDENGFDMSSEVKREDEAAVIPFREKSTASFNPKINAEKSPGDSKLIQGSNPNTLSRQSGALPPTVESKSAGTAERNTTGSIPDAGNSIVSSSGSNLNSSRQPDKLDLFSQGPTLFPPTDSQSVPLDNASQSSIPTLASEACSFKWPSWVDTNPNEPCIKLFTPPLKPQEFEVFFFRPGYSHNLWGLSGRFTSVSPWPAAWQRYESTILDCSFEEQRLKDYEAGLEVKCVSVLGDSKLKRNNLQAE